MPGSGAYNFKVFDGVIVICPVREGKEGERERERGEETRRKVIASQASLDLLLSSMSLTTHRS